MDGTHRTSVSVNSTMRFCESRTERGKSPTATQGLGFPSTPDTDSVQGRMLRAWRSLSRAVRVATRARGFEAMCNAVQVVRCVASVARGATSGLSADSGAADSGANCEGAKGAVGPPETIGT
eukprot:6208905-Pleurochrysis_carterae.AAC.1